MRADEKAKIRILLLGSAVEVHLQRWAAYLESNGYEVLTVSLEATDHFPSRFQRCHIPRVLPGFIRYPLAIPRVKRIASAFKPHLVNAHFLPNYGVIASLIRHAPWILTTWGSDIMVLPKKTLFHMSRTRFVLKRASFITSDAEVMTKRLVELGVSPARILTVPFGVDAEMFHPREKGSRTGGPKILTNRKLEKVYSVETLIDAFPGVKAKLPGAMLTIAGSGSLKKKLLARAKDKWCADDIIFIGNVEHHRVPALLREHDIYVSTSVSDTTSVSLLEAMACGLFPVVTDLPANREWIRDGFNGTRVSCRDPVALTDALISAWENPAFREEALERNREIIKERADWQQNMALVKALFEKILEEKERAASPSRH